MFSAEGRQGNHDGKRRKWNMHANNMAQDSLSRKYLAQSKPNSDINEVRTPKW